MPDHDHAHARLALRRLVSGLARPRVEFPDALTIDELLAMLDTDESADLMAVFDFIDDAARERPRFVYVEKDRDYKTGAPRGLLVIDLLNVDGHGHEAELFATCPTTVHARTLAETLNTHPPRMAPTPAGFDEEPF